jgi:hypothetical protein
MEGQGGGKAQRVVDKKLLPYYLRDSISWPKAQIFSVAGGDDTTRPNRLVQLKECLSSYIGM